MKKQSEKSSLMEWLAWGWFGLFILIALFHNGVFEGYGIWQPNQIQFEEPLLYELILSFFVGLWVMIALLSKQYKFEGRTLFALGALGLPIVYAISMIHAETPYLARYGLLVSIMIFIFYLAGSLVQNYERVIRLLPVVYIICGYFVIAYGFLILFGNAYLLDSLASVDGIRMSSIFQYPNGYAVFLLTIWIAVLVQMMKIKNRIQYVILASSLLPISLSFLLTLSRGALIILPVIAILALIMFNFRQQLLVIGYSLISMIIAIVIYSPIADRGYAVAKQIEEDTYNKKSFDTVSLFSGLSMKYWGLLIVGTLIMSAMAYLAHRFVAPRIATKLSNTYKWINKLIPLAIAVLFIIGAVVVTNQSVLSALPGFISDRVGDVNLKTQSVYERLIMYKDAVQVWKEHPIIGGGGGAWEALYMKHQSYPYSSNQTHSYFTQLMVETGLLGIVVFLLLIFSSLYMFIRFYRRSSESERLQYITYYLIVITILLHSLIDFEMSYGLFVVIIFFFLGILVGPQRQSVMQKIQVRKEVVIKRAIAGSTAILALLLLILSSLELSAFNRYMEAIKAGARNEPFETIQSKLKKALSSVPNHPVVLNQLIAWNYQAFNQTKDTNYLQVTNQYLAKLNNAEPHYRPAVEMNYLVRLHLEGRGAAIPVMEQALRDYPFTSTFYDQYAEDLESSWTQSNRDKQIGEEITALYNQMLNKEKVVMDLPESFIIGNRLAVTNAVRSAAASVQYENKNYPAVIEIAKSGLKEDLSNADDQRIALLYIAALNKQGEQDVGILDRLLKINPKAKDQLQDPLTFTTKQDGE